MLEHVQNQPMANMLLHMFHQLDSKYSSNFSEIYRIYAINIISYPIIHSEVTLMSGKVAKVWTLQRNFRIPIFAMRPQKLPGFQCSKIASLLDPNKPTLEKSRLSPTLTAQDSASPSLDDHGEKWYHGCSMYWDFQAWRFEKNVYPGYSGKNEALGYTRYRNLTVVLQWWHMQGTVTNSHKSVISKDTKEKTNTLWFRLLPFTKNIIVIKVVWSS